MEWWNEMTVSMRRVCIRLATRLRLRKSGFPKLRHDVRSCQYEDVRVMWEMLKRHETEQLGNSKKKPCWNLLEWARRAPCLCRNF